MTIKVMTAEHGEYTFPGADGWETFAGDLGDEGNLSVSKTDDDGDEVTLAEFAKGAWLFVVYSEDEDPADDTEEKPLRSWSSPAAAPDGVVKLVDGEGYIWERRGVRWGWLSSYNGEWMHVLHRDLRGRSDGPFTEVVE